MIILIALAMAYIFMAGMAYPFVLNKLEDRCPWSLHFAGRDSNHERVNRKCRDALRPQAVFLSLGGPVVLPFLMGSSITNRTDNIAKKEAAALTSAKNRKKVAEVEAETLAIQEKSAGLSS